jgi:hypothetical protein
MSKRKMCLARCNLQEKEDRKNEKSGSLSFAELVGLVRMNDRIKFT